MTARVARTAVAMLLAAILTIASMSPARADNCSGLSDCSTGVKIGLAVLAIAIAVALGWAVFGALASSAARAAAAEAAAAMAARAAAAGAGRGVAARVAAAAAAAGKGLNANQLRNLGRYISKLPSAAGKTNVTKLPGGGARFSTNVPGRVPGSYANYTKTVDAAGKTTGYTKTTYAPDGSIVHVKVKF